MMKPLAEIRPGPQYYVERLWRDPKAVEWVEFYRQAIRDGRKIKPILLQRNGFIVDGHHRWRAYTLEGVETVPVSY